MMVVTTITTTTTTTSELDSVDELASGEAKPRQNTTHADFYTIRSAISRRITYQLPPPAPFGEKKLWAVV